MPGYTYPDLLDKLLSAFISRFKAEGWRAEELYVLLRALRRAGSEARATLDLGTGLGRLIPVIRAPLTLGLDLALTRVREARKIYRWAADFIQGDAASTPLRDEAFDLVLCSHVIQHVPTWSVGHMLSEAYRVLKPLGWLILLASVSGGRRDLYLLVSWRGEAAVSEADFNRAAESPRPGVMPVRRLSPS